MTRETRQVKLDAGGRSVVQEMVDTYIVKEGNVQVPHRRAKRPSDEGYDPETGALAQKAREKVIPEAVESGDLPIKPAEGDVKSVQVKAGERIVHDKNGAVRLINAKGRTVRVVVRAPRDIETGRVASRAAAENAVDELLASTIGKEGSEAQRAAFRAAFFGRKM